MGAESADLRWGIEKRIEFIEFRLFWDGRVNRSDLTSAFGVSVNQASTDLNRYIGMAPDNMVYDKSARTYIRGGNFDPLFLKPDANRYLSQLRSVADGILDHADAWIGQFPSYDAAPTAARGVNAKTLRSVVAAIRRSEAIEVKYPPRKGWSKNSTASTPNARPARRTLPASVPRAGCWSAISTTTAASPAAR